MTTTILYFLIHLLFWCFYNKFSFTNSKVFVLIPTTPDKFGVEGVKDTIEDIEAVQEGFSFFGIDIVIAGIVITQVDKGQALVKIN